MRLDDSAAYAAWCDIIHPHPPEEKDTHVKIICNSFVKRQTAASPFSHFIGENWDTVAELAHAFWGKRVPGYKEGVVLVPVPGDLFCAGVIAVTDKTVLRTTFEARVRGEAPMLVTRGLGAKARAVSCDLVVYSPEVLGSDATPDGGADYEIVSINASATGDPEPMHPTAMMRNQLGLVGGTPASYSADEFARAILYWGTHVNVMDASDDEHG